MLKKVFHWVLEYFVLKVAGLVKDWIREQKRKREIKKRNRENAEKLKNAKTEKEKRDALDRIADDFGD